MIGRSAALDPLVMPAVERGVRRDVRHASGFPKGDFPSPVFLGTRTWRDPDLESDLGRVAARLLGQRAQFLECRQRLVTGRIVQRHETVAILCRTAEACFGIAAEPDRHAARRRARVDANILEPMELTGKGDVWFCPEGLHDPDLLLRSATAIAEVLVERDELDLVPPDADAEAE